RDMSPWRAEFRVRRPDGRELWIEGHSMPEREADGSLLWHGFLHDVTDRKRLERELRASEHRFRQIAESLPQLVWTAGPDGEGEYLSPQWLTYTGGAEADQLSGGWAEYIHPDDREQAFEAWHRALATGTDVEVLYRVRRADGVYRWFQVRASPLRDADGR